MGKKSKLKSEKQKVQINSKTKFLPKGLNVTNTAFKIKSINIIKQLKETTTQRNVTVSELLAKLNNSSYNRKIELFDDLTHIINNSPDTTRPWVLLIMQGVLPHIQDRDSKVRRASISVIDLTLKKFPNQYDALFHLMSANLRCSMTNIDKNIQEDSLLLLDSFLNHVPALIAKDFKKILRDFLTLTSKLRNNSNVDRTLTVNLDSKLTSVRWRIKVLSQLYGILKVIIGIFKIDHNSYCAKSINAHSNDGYYIPIYRNCNFEPCAIDYFHVNSLVDDVDDNSEDNSTVLMKNINVVITLLYETWLEVVPDKSLKKMKNETTILNKDAAAILLCIVNILYLLYEYTQTNKALVQLLASKEWTLLLTHLLDNFPYVQNERTPQTPHMKKDLISSLFAMTDDKKCVQQNLLISVFYFLTKKNDKNIRIHSKSITMYINKCLTIENYVAISADVKYLIIILRKILIEETKFWRNNGWNVNEILNNALTFYRYKSGENQVEILKILTNVMKNQLLINNGSSDYEEWFRRLPLMLCEGRISDKSVKILLQLSKQNITLFDETLRANIVNILNNLPKINIYGTDNEELSKINIIYIFYYINYVTEDDLANLEQFINTYSSSKQSIYYKHLVNVQKVWIMNIKRNHSVCES